MTDKQRIAALRKALRETVTAWQTEEASESGQAAIQRLRAINSTALRALRDDDHAEIAGGEDDRLMPSDPASPLEFRPDGE